MYKLTYNHNYHTETFKSFDLLTDELNEYFSSKIIDDVAQTFEKCDYYSNVFFVVSHYVGYFYKGQSYATLYALAEKLVKEVDEERKVDWFIENVGICARKDDGGEIDLPWYDMICDDYDHKEYDGALVEEIDGALADEIEKALDEVATDKGSFVFSFWDSDFTIEVEEEDCFDMADNDNEDEFWVEEEED
jgi:hypothetical protein